MIESEVFDKLRVFREVYSVEGHDKHLRCALWLCKAISRQGRLIWPPLKDLGSNQTEQAATAELD